MVSIVQSVRAQEQQKVSAALTLEHTERNGVFLVPNECIATLLSTQMLDASDQR